MHPSSRRRRRHSDELKAKVAAACGEPGASISAVALAHGLNANLVRKWRTGRGAKPAGTAAGGINPGAAVAGECCPRVRRHRDARTSQGCGGRRPRR
jgi:transposase-like protein